MVKNLHNYTQALEKMQENDTRREREHKMLVVDVRKIQGSIGDRRAEFHQSLDKQSPPICRSSEGP